MTIGTFNEGPLHRSLKAFYGAGGVHEAAVDGYVADVRGTDDVLYEIQTAGFGALKKKLTRLVEIHRVVLVHPIAEERYIVKFDDDELKRTRRRSPKRGKASHVLEELVSLPELLEHPNFEVEVVMIVEEEHRAFGPERVRRRRGWRVVERRLVKVNERLRIRNARDLFRFVPRPLPARFTTRDLAEAMEERRWLAQKLAYVLREAGAISICGKAGNALVYSRTERQSPPAR